jgi:arylsulfatase A-like enzyme
VNKPSLLYIFTDQQRADTMACYGNDAIETPALNALADKSFVFENAYVSQPVCSPSRATMLAGLYPHTARVPACNVPLPTDVQTIAEMVDPSCRRHYFGKWHLGDEIFPQHGFTEWTGSEDSYRAHFSSPDKHETLSPYWHFLKEQGLEPDGNSFGKPIFSRHFEASLPEPLTKATFLGNQAADFIRNVGQDRFVACVSYLEPHPPHTGPLNDMYDPDQLSVGPHFMEKPGPDASMLNRVMAAYYGESVEYGFDLRTEAGWRGLRARYCGNVTLIDRSVGMILKALEESGRAEDTIVVFTSDHGEMVGDHGILGKTVLYEESVRVPLIVRVSGLSSEQTKIAGNISHIDLVPTLLDLMDEQIPDHLQGISRSDVLKGEASLETNDIFIEWNGADGHPRPGEAEVNPAMGTPWRTVITADRWKLNLSNHDTCELFDLNNDPYEQTNRYDDPTLSDRVCDMKSRITDWQESVNDTVPLPV